MRSPLNQWVILTGLLASILSYSEGSGAQTVSLSTAAEAPTAIRFTQLNATSPGRGTPPTREGTGSRGSCLAKQDLPPLTRLVGSETLNLTVQERPVFWVYVPYSATESPAGEFSLQLGDQEIYRTRFQLPTAPGVVSVELPATVAPLQVGQDYRWYLDLDCPQTARARSGAPASITGGVRRLEPPVTLQTSLAGAKTALERVAAYADHGIWYDTLTELAQLRLQQPQDAGLRTIWVNLLSDRAVGLDRIAPMPLAGAITSSQPK